MMLRGLVIVAFLALAGCASSDRSEVLRPVAATVPDAKVVDLHVGTSRVLGENGNFTSKRSTTLAFQNLKVSIPPSHKSGEIEWPPAGAADPSRHFVTLANSVQTQQQFLRGLEASLPPGGEVTIFIHGFNTEHEEAVYRLAQMKVDSSAHPAAVLFSWPSRGDATAYVTDRESILSSRNRLEELVTLISKSSKVRRIHLFAHSMGGMLTIDTLAQATVRNGGHFGGKLGMVIFADPDIDLDVFVAMFETIGRRPQPTVVLTSRDDKALALSRFIAGDVGRVGAQSTDSVQAQQFIRKYDLTVIDMTAVKTGDASNHTKFAAQPAVLQQLAGQLDGGLVGGRPPVGTVLLNTAGGILDGPGKFLRSLSR